MAWILDNFRSRDFVKANLIKEQILSKQKLKIKEETDKLIKQDYLPKDGGMKIVVNFKVHPDLQRELEAKGYTITVHTNNNSTISWD